MDINSKIYIAGRRGMVGSAIERRLMDEGLVNIVGPTSQELDLTDSRAVMKFFSEEKPEYLFLAAAKVGGIYANSTYPAEFIYQNLMIECNLIHGAYKAGVKKLLFLGSSCIYPKHAPQPIREEYLLDGKLEPTNEPYAIAKIAGLKLCESYNRQYGTDFISCMPANLYGQNDSYDPMNSHVIPALIRRFHEAKVAMRSSASGTQHSTHSTQCESVVIWGTGAPRREFLYVDDLADACVFLMKNYSGSETVNVGSGSEVTIRELAATIRDVVGFKGEIVFDASRPDGTPRKLLDCGRLSSMGWRAKTRLKEGLKRAYEDYLRNYVSKETIHACKD
ncbi:MAG TPA: GDP-L-fucose synthase [Thermodesulfovibrionales bacterium]|nr:GDP-L-fucose synthase [Thermodesulfovibrionales bacterium]